MDIYKRKSRLKLFLLLIAFVIAATSLVYTNHLAGKIAKEEENKVRLWAEALEERASLVRLTGELFDRIADQQRQDVEIWAEATSLIIKTEDVESITFLSKIITQNTNIPVLLTDQDDQILDFRNIEIADPSPHELTLLLETTFSYYPPIEIQFPNGKNFIYYSDSKLFTDLKVTLNDLIESFISEIVVNSASVPVVLVNENDQYIAGGNIDSLKLTADVLPVTIAAMQDENAPIQIDLGDGGKRFLYYQNSFMLKQLKIFPFVQLFLFGVFILAAYLAFSSSRNAEQNRVWVGMAKETAHQLGTPISSLSAWVEMMKDLPKEQWASSSYIQEVEKDINRLELIAERFSKIGSKSELEKKEVQEVLESAVHYVKLRASDQVTITTEYEGKQLFFFINEALFNWVIENLLKNALDAMEGIGRISIRAFQSSRHVIIDISDTGKGISRGDYDKVFQPGYSTKKRGWGLGLSLAKRIIEKYHKGKIFIKSSSDEGTVFRIKLPI